MSPRRRDRILRGFVRALLFLYPKDFREFLGPDLEQTYVDRMAGMRERGKGGAFLRTLGLVAWHSLRDGVLERVVRMKREREGSTRIRSGNLMFQATYQALRGLRRRPVFYSAVILVFTLGIAANTLIFSLVHGILLQPLPYPGADRLLLAWQTHPHWLNSDNPGLRARWDRLEVSFPVFRNWREMSPVFDDLGLYMPSTLIATGQDQPQRLRGAMATSGVFRALGVAPSLGRTFLEEEDDLGGPSLVVLSHGLWAERFGADPDVLGRTMILDEEPHTIVGVMPPGFRFPGDARLWATFPDFWREMGRNSQIAPAVARLKPGVTLDSAQREMEILQGRLNELHPIPGRNYGVNLVGLHEETVGKTRPVLNLLWGSVLVFLLIGCANITNLLLLRASERRRELAVRLSLGAGRRQLLSQLLTEGVVLSVIGGGCGVLLAVAGLDPFLHLLPQSTPRLNEVSINPEVLIFSLFLSVATGMVASLIPGLVASGKNLSSVMKDSGRGTTGGRQRKRVQFALLVSEVALSFVLLVGAGLLARSLSRLTSVDPGFSSQGIVVLDMDMRGSRYQEKENAKVAYEELSGRLKALPGVVDVALASPGPFSRTWSNGTTVETEDGPVETNTFQEDVSPDYFEVMGIRLLAGRTFTQGEIDAGSPVVIVNETLARAFWPDGQAVGKRLMPTRDWLTIVGVVSDTHRRLDQDPFFTLYHPLQYDGASAIIKAAVDPTVIIRGAREALRAVDPDIPIISLATLDANIARTVTEPRVRTMLLGAFAACAALLVVLGISGLLAQTVSQRRAEIGIRMALGAHSGTVMRGVLAWGMVVLGLGLILGLVAAFLAVRILRPFLFQVGETDPMVLGGVAALLTISTLGASLVPARRATRIDPVQALREE